MDESDILFYLMTALVGFLIGLSKGGLGGLLGSLATPLMSLVMPPEQVIGLLLPMLMFADVFAMSTYWRRWQTRYVLLLLPGGIAGVTVATLFITHAPTDLLRTALGIIVLIFTAYKLLENRILRWMEYKGHDWHGILAGILAGFSSTLAHAGGPPVAIYLLLQKLTPLVFNATTVLFFTVLNWIKVPYYFYAGLFDFERLRQVIWLLPVIPLGVWLGRRLAGVIDRQTFERIIVVLLFITGVMLILE